MKLLCGFSVSHPPVLYLPLLHHRHHFVSHALSFFHFSISRHFRDRNVYEVFLAYKAITLYYLLDSTSFQIRVRVFLLIFSRAFIDIYFFMAFFTPSLSLYSVLKKVLLKVHTSFECRTKRRGGWIKTGKTGEKKKILSCCWKKKEKKGDFRLLGFD